MAAAAASRAGEGFLLAAARVRTFVDREAYAVMLVALYAFGLARLAPHELVQDSWLTLVSGREIAWNGLPSRDTLTVFGHGADWVDQQWLAQLGFYGAYVLGGLKAVLVAHVALVAGAFALGLAAARRLGASPRSVFVVGIAAFLLAPWTWQLRSQSAAYLLFVAVVWLLVRDVRDPGRRTFLVLPLLALWANLHGSVVLGAALVMLRGASLVVERARAREPVSGWAARAAALVVAPPLVLLASPYGLDLVGYYERMLVGPEFARIVGEWRPPTFPRAIPFFVLALAAVWLLARARRVSGFEKAIVLFSIVGGLLAIRSITWFAFTALVVLPSALDDVVPPRARMRPHGRPIRLLAGVAAVAIPATFAVMALVPTRTYERLWPEPAAIAVAEAAASDPSVRVFASDRYADWLLWKRPELAGRIAYDVRFELHSKAELDALFDYYNHVGSDWAAATEGYELVVVDRTSRRAGEEAILREGGTRLYEDEHVAVLRRPAR
jgi:hypothetical protein